MQPSERGTVLSSDTVTVHYRTWRDPLIATMAYFLLATDAAQQPPPPLVPMVMQLINVHALGIHAPNDSGPNWHSRAFCRCNDLLHGKRVPTVPRMSLMVDQGDFVSSHEFASCIPTITALSVLSDVSDWSFLSTMHKLQELSLARVQDCASMLRLPTLPTSLRKVSLRGGRDAPSLEKLALLPWLTDLRIDCPVADITCLCAVPHLTSVAIKFPTLSIAAVQALGRFPSLTVLDLRSCTAVDDVSGLAESVSLHTLYLHPITARQPSLLTVCTSVPTLRKIVGVPLSHVLALCASRPDLVLPQELMKHFDVDELRRVASFINHLELGSVDCPLWTQLLHLTTLNVENAFTEVDLSALATLPVLADVSLGFRSNTCPSRGSWSGSSSLKVLKLGNDGRLEGLDAVPSLQDLHCAPHTAADMRVLHGCRSLVKLSLWGDAVTTTFLPYLEGMMSLERLEFMSCSNLAAVAHMEGLQLPRLLSVFLSSTGVFDEHGQSERLNAVLRQRHLHTSWYLKMGRSDVPPSYGAYPQ